MKKNLPIIILSVIMAILMLGAPLLAGKNVLTPKVIKGTWKSDTVSLTFSGRDDVVLACGDVQVDGSYVNGTTGTTLVIWFDLGENCPEELKFLESTRETYFPYSTGEDAAGEYMQIDGVKYYKQG